MKIKINTKFKGQTGNFFKTTIIRFLFLRKIKSQPIGIGADAGRIYIIFGQAMARPAHASKYIMGIH